MRTRGRAIAFVALLALLPLPAFAQNAGLRGQLLDSRMGTRVAEARLTLKGLPDTTEVRGAISDTAGRFVLRELSLHAYRLEVDRLGYARLDTTIRLTSRTSTSVRWC